MVKYWINMKIMKSIKKLLVQKHKIIIPNPLKYINTKIRQYNSYLNISKGNPPY